ncbi:TPA: DUF979 domain-containing protein [Enterococcus faecalis]|nr:DUF979 domain-containing protein [Enterococcus faecalis]
MSFFTDPSIDLSAKLLEVLYIFMGIILLYTSFRSFRDKTNQHAYGTSLFWGILGILIGFGRFIPPVACGVLIFVMTIPAILQKVTKGESRLPSKEYMEKMSQKLGMKIFIPALSIGVFAILFATLTTLGALVGVGVGEIISKGVSAVVPAGNVNVGIIIYAVGMVIFTAIMGNAFAAITVMTVGIGVPFVFSLGADPALVGMVALTCGFCGTLLTPMAANFNIVPVAMLEMKDKYGVIKNQLPIALFMLIFQIVYMILFK